MAKTRKKANFEDQLQELEEIVAQLDGDTLSLEESLKLFEKGILLSRRLQGALESASLRVTQLLEGGASKEVKSGDVPTSEGTPSGENSALGNRRSWNAGPL